MSFSAAKIATAKLASEKTVKDAASSRKSVVDEGAASLVEQVLFLQRNIGNQAVSKLMRSRALQAKFKIGPVGDCYEQEADRVAQAVTCNSEDSIYPSKTGAKESGEPFSIHRKPEGSGTLNAPNDFDMENRILKATQNGQPLPKDVSAFFAPRLGYDFKGVRIHTDSEAAASAKELNASAYTVGRDVVFGQGEYSPGTSRGLSLIAHELTHVLQQSGGGIRSKIIQRQTSPAKTPPAPVAHIMPQEIKLERLRLLVPVRKWLQGRLFRGQWHLEADELIPLLLASYGKNRRRDKQVLLVVELQELLDTLIQRNVLRRSVLGTGYTIVSVKPLEKVPEEIKDLEERKKSKDPLMSMFPTAQIPKDWSPDPRIAKTEERIQKELEKLRVLTVYYAAQSMKVPEIISDRIKRYEEALKHFARYRTFAAPIVQLLTRLRAKSGDYTFSNYKGHYWGEFSIDVFINAKRIRYNFDENGKDITIFSQMTDETRRTLDPDSGLYWERNKVRLFFRDLNAASMDASDGKGQFAWRAVYNDRPLANEINSDPAYGGKKRIGHAKYHGPAPDYKLHIHLDVAPVQTMRLTPCKTSEGLCLEVH